MAAPDTYFIALVIKGEQGKAITSIKQYVSSAYHSRRALNSPPHITLVPPFKMKRDREAELSSSISDLISGNQEIRIVLDGFGAFKPRVIFIHPENNIEMASLRDNLFKGLAAQFDEIRYDPRPFHPHVTIAFRDLTVQEFRKAWQEFKDNPFSAEYTCTTVALLKHNGSKWEIIQEIPFHEKENE